MSRLEREHPRYAHEAAITLNPQGSAIQGRTRNVSRGGLCATLVDAITNGSDVLVDIQLVFEDDVHSEPLQLAARVVWCTALDDGHQVGLRFMPLDAEKTELLTIFLRYLDDTVSGKIKKPQTPIDERFG